MRDGWEYVAAAYGVGGLTFVIWFWMIGVKLRRQSRTRAAEQGAGVTRGEADRG